MADTTKSLFVDQYLKRLQYSGPVLPNLETLQQLHHHHMLSIPFENLSNIKNEEYLTTKHELFQKIIQGKRGGLCFELNTLFRFLLQELGFEVITCLAIVFSAEKNSFPPLVDSHLISMVHLDGQQWLADVGFGDGFTMPLRLLADEVQDGGDAFYRLKKVDKEDSDHFIVEAQGRRGDLSVALGSAKDNIDFAEWTYLYSFTTKSRSSSYFDEHREYILKSPESLFNQGLLCTVLRTWGRLTLTRRKFIKTYIENKKVVKRDVEVFENEEDAWITLEKEFDVKYN